MTETQTSHKPLFFARSEGVILAIRDTDFPKAEILDMLRNTECGQVVLFASMRPVYVSRRSAGRN